MHRFMFLGKIHRATVTEADQNYEGSVTIDSDLMERADILPHQEVAVWNITNGERFKTYALAGKPGSGVICINGAAAHKARKGDMVIIATFGYMNDDEARCWQPKVCFVDEQNRPKELRAEQASQAEVLKVTWQ